MTTAARARAATPIDSDDTGDRRLLLAASVFSAAVIVHNGDHLRRGVANLGHDVFAVGMLGILLEVGMVVLVAQRHRLAPLVAAYGGALLAAGYLEVHALPAHRWLSDSFTGGGASPLSWVAASLEIVTALVLAAVAIGVLRRRGGLASALRPHTGERRIGAALTHPLSLLMIATQAAAAAASFVQLAR